MEKVLSPGEIKPGTPLYLLAEPFRKALSDVLTQVLASPWSVAITGEDTPAASESVGLCFGLSASGGLQGNAAFQLKNVDALLLAQKLLPEPADPAAELNPNHEQAVEDLLRKLASTAATALKGQFGEVTLQLDRVDAPAWRGASVTFVASEAATTVISVKIQFDSDLLASARLPMSKAAPPASTAAEAPKKPSVPGENNLDLLLGLDLNLTLRFGQRTVTLREVLDLSSSSIIELDRQVQEPAELLLGDKLIARGEVVMVNGNYGLRITEVSNSQAITDRIGLPASR